MENSKAQKKCFKCSKAVTEFKCQHLICSECLLSWFNSQVGETLEIQMDKQSLRYKCEECQVQSLVSDKYVLDNIKIDKTWDFVSEEQLDNSSSEVKKQNDQKELQVQQQEAEFRKQISNLTLNNQVSCLFNQKVLQENQNVQKENQSLKKQNEDLKTQIQKLQMLLKEERNQQEYYNEELGNKIKIVQDLNDLLQLKDQELKQAQQSEEECRELLMQLHNYKETSELFQQEQQGLNKQVTKLLQCQGCRVDFQESEVVELLCKHVFDKICLTTIINEETQGFFISAEGDS